MGLLDDIDSLLSAFGRATRAARGFSPIIKI